MNYSACSTFQAQFLPPIYGVEFCVALLSNLIALWILVTRQRTDWHTGVVLSCNLVISDLLYVFTLPLQIDYYIIEKDWHFGEAACKIERFLFNCNLYVSIYFIMCISVTRYMAIVHPFFTRNNVSPAKAKVASVIIWMFVIAISSPVLKFTSTCPAANNTTHCVLNSYCATSNKDAEYFIFTYRQFLAVIGCFVPFLVTFVSYAALLRVVWRNKNITSLEKRKVALMVLAVVLLYAICFLPYHIQNTSEHFTTEFIDCRLYKTYQVFKGLVSMNMCIHPLLYVAVFNGCIKMACTGARAADMAMDDN